MGLQSQKFKPTEVLKNMTRYVATGFKQNEGME